jgi:hypothetical protein
LELLGVALPLGASFWVIGLVFSDVAAGKSSTDGGVTGLFAFAIGVGFAFPAVRALRQLRHAQPVLRLDHQGFECAVGRVAWKNVERISFTNVDAIFRVRLASPLPAGAGGFASKELLSSDCGTWRAPWYGRKAPTTAHGIYVRLSPGKKQTVDAILGFFGGEIGAPIPGEGREPSDSNRGRA